MDVQFPIEHFDAIVSFYAIFHLPREEHPVLFRRIHLWPKEEGYFLATVAQTSQAQYTENDIFLA